MSMFKKGNDIKFKVGDMARNKKTGRTYLVTGCPGDKKYDSTGFCSSESGLLLKDGGWVWSNEYEVLQTKFKVGEEVVDSWHPGVKSAVVIAIVSPIANHPLRYLVLHNDDGHIAQGEEQRFLSRNPSLSGKVVKVELDGVSYEAVIK